MSLWAIGNGRMKQNTLPASSAGQFRPKWLWEVTEAREEILTLLSNGSSLFNREWINWKPDPSWEVPRLPPDWDVVCDVI
jgi:hypothetical protein